MSLPHSTPAAPNVFDRVADAYDAEVQSAIRASGESVAYFAELKARIAARELGPGGILDFGCGVGNLARALTDRIPGAAITGCDTSADSLAVARTRAPGLAFSHLPGAVLPFEAGSFDAVTAACVFHHIEPDDRPAWMRELARVLRPGGRLLLFEHNPYNPLTRRVVRNVSFDAGVSLLTRRAAHALVRAAGLRVARSYYYFFFPRVLAWLRPAEPALGWLPLGGQYVVVAER